MSLDASVIGVDVGGTFTDVFMLSRNGAVASAKAHSTPPDFARGVLDALGELSRELEVPLEEVLGSAEYLCHGTTATLNALLTGEVAKVGLITTKGHRDSIFIMNLEGRHMGLSPEEIQNFVHTSKPEPLLPKRLTLEVTERVDAHGEVIVPLDEGEARAVIGALLEQGVEGIAVSLLWSFLEPRHELRIRELVDELAPDLTVGLSHEVSPRIREFARHSTTIMNTQVRPTLAKYLVPLRQDLSAKGLRGSLLVMQGSGGSVAADEAPRDAINTVGSVLTGGAMGALTLARQLGQKNVIAADIGGTTFLVSLIVDGRPVFTNSWVINRHPVSTVMVRVEAIGSGGGAISWIDEGGNLRVGPQSAGAVPGPACYGDGGTAPTNTDANVVLGIIHPDRFLGSRKRLRRELAERAIEESVARPLGLSVEEAAAAIFAIQNGQTADVVSKLVLQTGHDPRDFVIYAFGGAGPIHCHAFGRDLGVREILVPLGRTAAAFSAFGLATSDVTVTRELSDPAVYPIDAERINRNFRRLEQEAASHINRQGIKFESVQYRREIDIRYTLQIAEVATPVKLGELVDDDVPEIVAEFERVYTRAFGDGAGFTGAGFQLMTYRVFAVGTMPRKVELPAIASSNGHSASDVIREWRPVLLDPARGFENTPIYDYRDLRAGYVFPGPAVVEASATTVAVGGGQLGMVDRLGNIVIREEQA
jgi:N-methylhydantoinase A